MAHADVEGSDATTIFAPGAGAAVNCILELVNVVGMDNWIQFSTVGMHRSKDPGAGAFTPFYNRQVIAREEIRQGDELFDSYGEGYFGDRPDLFGNIPLNSEHHELADELLESYLGLQQTIDENNSLHRDWYNLMRDLGSNVWFSRALGAWPEDPDKAEQIANYGTVYTHEERSRRSIEWLQENGLCMDHLEAKPSTLPQAGRGAFAKRSLRKGDIVGPAPVLHMPRDVMNIYPFEVDYNGALHVNKTAGPVHQQLMLNYCFGSNESSVVLCPYGHIVPLINHSRDKPNVKVEWNRKLSGHAEWLNMFPEQWVNELHTGLVMNFVALADIAEGEELFLDYGEEWQRHWDDHVRNWRPPPDADKYVPAVDLNEQEEVIRTVYEGGYDETHMDLKCHDFYRIDQGLLFYDDDEKMYHCRAIHRRLVDGEYLYTVEVYTPDATEIESTLFVDEVLWNVPRDAFEFVDKRYSRDHSQFWSFRHPIGLPDDMLPSAWRDVW